MTTEPGVKKEKSPRQARRSSKAQRKICVLGYAEETRGLVFNLDETYEVWGINAAHYFTHKSDTAGSVTQNVKAKVTNWFQLHPRDWAGAGKNVTGYFGRPKEHLDFLAQFEGTVWLRSLDKDIPNGKVYPLAEIQTASGRLYFTSTFAYQLGLIWYQHVYEKNPVEEVVVYGVNLTSIDEYIHQKPCVEYWLGRLEEAGIRVRIPAGSALIKGKVYAIGGDSTDTSDHAYERLQVHKSNYMQAWANNITGKAMKMDTQFWINALTKYAEAPEFKELFTDELKQSLQETMQKRMDAHNALINQSTAQMNGHLGEVKEGQHWLALTGGIDHRAPELPDERHPSPQLSGEYQLPKPTAI